MTSQAREFAALRHPPARLPKHSRQMTVWPPTTSWLTPSRRLHAAARLPGRGAPCAMTFCDERIQRRLARLGGPELGNGLIERPRREHGRWSVPGLDA